MPRQDFQNVISSATIHRFILLARCLKKIRGLPPLRLFWYIYLAACCISLLYLSHPLLPYPLAQSHQPILNAAERPPELNRAWSGRLNAYHNLCRKEWKKLVAPRPRISTITSTVHVDGCSGRTGRKREYRTRTA
jgi:hypothetical protein